MIGFYDYTVVLTYLSLISAGCGIFVSLAGGGHPYIGVFFLLACGLFDAFDGRVARTKKDRTETQRNFGIQIDSLADVVAFGVLPACIGGALLRTSPLLKKACSAGTAGYILTGFLSSILILFILAAMIRLAYFNVTEEERQKSEAGCRKYYLGVPVTSVSLIAPLVIFLGLVFPGAFVAYFGVMLFLGIAFILPVKIPKPGLRGILIMVGFGVVEFAFLIIAMILRSVR